MSEPGDALERAADRVADAALSMPLSSPVRIANTEERRPRLSRTSTTRAPVSVSPDVHNVIRSHGTPLDPATRGYFEPRLGYELSQVRTHTDAAARDSARTLSARAYTVGQHIAFGAGEYAPHTGRGRRLMAHELAHVIQQDGQDHGIQRQCLSGAVCGRPTETAPAPPETSATPPPAAPVTIAIPGAPGAFGASASEARTAAGEERRREEAASRTRSGQGRRATFFERFGRAQGIDLAPIHGVFVDLDIRREGGYAWTCRSFRDFAEPFAGDPSARCVFIPQRRENEAQQFLEHPDLGTIGGRSREDWRVSMTALFTHEVQHVLFGRSTQPDNPAGRCSLSTTVYRGGGSDYDVRHYLSELSAILSEFPVQYRARQPSSLEGMDWWFNSIVRRHGESINGILTNLRCVCDCDEVDEYIRQTVSFTASSWSELEQTYLNYALSQQRINWPIAAASTALETLRQALEARHPARRHTWTLTPELGFGYATTGSRNTLTERLGLDFGFPLDRLRRWAVGVGIHETMTLSIRDYMSFLTGMRASLTLTTPGIGVSFRGGLFGELGGAAIQESVPGARAPWRPDVYAQTGLTLGLTIPIERARVSIGADILGGTTFGAGGSQATPWFGVGLRFGIEFFRGGN